MCVSPDNVSRNLGFTFAVRLRWFLLQVLGWQQIYDPARRAFRRARRSRVLVSAYLSELPSRVGESGRHVLASSRSTVECFTKTARVLDS